jgi:hypothetical protein
MNPSFQISPLKFCMQNLLLPRVLWAPSLSSFFPRKWMETSTNYKIPRYAIFPNFTACVLMCSRVYRCAHVYIDVLTHIIHFQLMDQWTYVIHLSHTNKCTNYIIYYLKSVLIIDIKTLSYYHSSYMFRHIICHPQAALMFLVKTTGKTICKTWTYIVWGVFMFYKLFYQWF